MTAITIRINGREYKVACDEGEEDKLHGLAQDIDERIGQLVSRMGPRGENIMLVLAALMMADELDETKKDLVRLRNEITDTAQSFERGKMIEMGNAISLSMEDIASRIEKIAEQIEG